MALLSVQRTPTILGTLQVTVTANKATAGGWQVYRSGDFTSMGGGATTGTLRFHTVTLANNGPVAVRVAMDTSTSATALFAAVSFYSGFTLNVEETIILDVSTLGGAAGVRRIMFINDILYNNTFNAPDYAAHVQSNVDVQVGFYTAHQSAAPP